nr:acyl--CoA ligase [Blastocatellia bacterium]
MNYSNISDLLALRVADAPDKTFLISEADGREWGYSAFREAIGKTAGLLVSRGVLKGDVVSLLLPNSAEYVIAYFACWQIGAVAGPVNSLLKAEEIEWVVNNSEAKLMLTSAEWFEKVPERLRTADAFVSFDDVHVAAGECRANMEPPDINADDEAIIIYTSGTTGKPKGCLLTHGNVLANARQIAKWMGFGPQDRLLTVMPLFHMNAVSVTTMAALYAGGSTVVAPKFSASRFWETIEKYQVTSFGSVATMLSILLSEPATGAASIPAFRSLRFAMCGSAPVPPQV